MKIFHISDLHLDKNYRKSNFDKTLHLLERIVDEGFDHLIISGDITENAESSSFEMARQLLKKFGLLKAERTTVVIGNHDIYGGVHLAEDILNFPARCKALNYRRKVEEFEYYFRETFENTLAPSKNSYFPFIKEFDEFLLIGLNSIAGYSALKNPFASNGEISDIQLKQIKESLSHKSFDGKKRIAITHHHFCKESAEGDSSGLWRIIERQTMKLRHKKTIIKKLKKLEVDLVLHGHLHETNEYNRKGLKFINSGGTILGYKKNEIRIQELSVRSENIENKLRVFNYYRNEIAQLEFSQQKAFYTSIHTPKEIFLN